MTDSARAKMNHLDLLIAKGTQFQIALKSIGQPLGPAKVEAITEEIGAVESVGGSGNRSVTVGTGLYRIFVDMEMAQGPNKRATRVKVPWVFHVDDVAVIMEPPLNAEGDKLVHTPGNGNTRTAGGLVIPG